MSRPRVRWDRGFESGSLQRRVCKPSVPRERFGSVQSTAVKAAFVTCFIPYRDRWCAADRRRSDGHPVLRELHFSNTEHCRFASNWSVRLLRPRHSDHHPNARPA